MKFTRVVPLLAAFVLLTAFVMFDGARRFLDLKDTTGGRASGEATIEPLESRMPDLRTLGIIVYGLKPASVYSLWYEDENGKRLAAGVKTNHFTTNADGKGRYVTMVYEYDIDDWRYLVVMYHPDGDPKNIGGMTQVLRGDLVYGTHT